MTNSDAKLFVTNEIEAQASKITSLSDQIWNFAELSLQEYKSCDLYCKTLQDLGFSVEKSICQIDTAFLAKYGSGRPYIGILAEYDALSGLSQKAGACQLEEIIPGGNGHGCGHNLLGAGALAAAIGIKAYLEKSGCSGTVFLYGCPGEEGGASKAFMARDRIFENLDAALTWHPEDNNEVVTGSTNSCIQVQYKFTGVASHASGAPELGRSALDAVELMNIGVQFLREHTSDDARIHYAITDAGGISPNVVQPRASVLYMVRSQHVKDAIALQERVDRIAEGAALMTDTTFERKFIDGLADTITNHTLEHLLYKNFEALGVPSYTDEEYDFADNLAKTYDAQDHIPGFAASYDILAKETVLREQKKIGHSLNAFLSPLYRGEAFRAGSTDVGDVSWLVPTAQIHVAAWPNGCPGHSWQNVSCGGTSIGHKALLHAGKVLACTAIDLFEDPDILRQAKEEFLLRTKDGYHCPIPKDAVPVIPD